MKVGERRLKAIARELVYDIVIAEIDSGSVNRLKLASCLGLEEDGDEMLITNEMIEAVEVHMQNLVFKIIRQGKLAR